MGINWQVQSIPSQYDQSSGSVYQGIYFGLKQENLLELLPQKWYTCATATLIVLNTCYPSGFLSTGCKCHFPFVKAGITSLEANTLRKPVVLVRTQALKLHKNFGHLKYDEYSMRVNKKNILAEYSSFFTPCLWTYLQLNKIKCIETTLYQLCLRRFNPYPPRPCLLVTVSTCCRNPEISPPYSGFFEFLALVFDKWWNTKKSLGVFLLTFSTTTNNDENSHIYYGTLTSLRVGFDYVWGTPTWRIATVVKRRVTWVKTKNRWFTVTLQCDMPSIQVSTDFPGYLATCSQHRRCDTYK